ncbi:hypothetical protein DPMN_109058 [Dreissena polymorpha]|uniref:Uncharacterized protein n=1 Tax=Dreissena polymorpha TaxID=45954 RepID=A0A9D4KA28_DREPO|nr:hypothetical protein DPMN_109058 [Dreissena polymorpha]
MNRFVKEDLVQNASVKKLMDMDMDKKDNLLPLEDIKTGESKTMLVKLGEEKRKPLLRDMQKFYTVTADYLRKKLPLTQNVVKYAQCLHPEVRDENTAMRYVRSLAEEMPGITPNEVAMICDEWKVYRVEKIENSVMYGNDDKLKRVDHFWNEQKICKWQPKVSYTAKTGIFISMSNPWKC